MFFYLGDFPIDFPVSGFLQGSAEVISEFTELLSQLRKDPGDFGPELFRMNDRCNELLKQLPLQPLGPSLKKMRGNSN